MTTTTRSSHTGGRHAAEQAGAGASMSGDGIRVTIVAPSLGILGGQAIQATRLIAGLSTMPGISVSFLPVDPRLPGILGRLQRVKYVRTLLTETAYLISLLRRLRNADVVHIFSASYFSFLLAPTPALLVARLYGKRTILNYRSGEAADHLVRWRSAVPTLKLADEIVVPSGYLADVFGRVGLRTSIVANVVDLDRFRFRTRSPLRPVFLANRNFEAHYNVACVLRAFAIIRDAVPGAELIVAGDGGERSRLEQLARELGSSGIRFVGRVPPERMPDLYDAADIYLNAPSIDNMPASIIEAFAAGLPVVSTRAGGIPYIVEHGRTGVLVDLDDHEALAAGALQLLRSPDTAMDMARRAYEECRARYRWDAVGQQWLQLYLDVLAGRTPTVAASLPGPSPDCA